MIRLWATNCVLHKSHELIIIKSFNLSVIQNPIAMYGISRVNLNTIIIVQVYLKCPFPLFSCKATMELIIIISYHIHVYVSY